MRLKKVISLTLIFLVALCFKGVARAESNSIMSRFLSAEVQSKPFVMRILDNNGKTLLETRGELGFAIVRGQKTPFDKGKEENWTQVSEAVDLVRTNNHLQVELADKAGSEALVRMKIFFIDEKTIRVESEVLNQPQVNRIRIKFLSRQDDLYYGMGERYNTAQQKGNLVYNWTQEGCLIGCENTVVTYFPVPFFLNPRGYGFLLDDTHYSEFDFGKTEPGIFSLTNFNSRMDLMIFYGPSPLEVIENYTAYTGRVTVPAPWAFGVWNAADEGSPRAREVARITRQEKIPTSAIWSEDWAWPVPISISESSQQEPSQNSLLLTTLWIWINMIKGIPESQWELNRNRYPDYEKLAQELHQEGFRFLGYFMPYLGAKSQAFKQGEKLGHLAKDPGGKAAIFRWLVPKVGEPDLTDPNAREWWQKTFFQKALDYGVDGWMHDFGEYTPTWAKFADGRDGWAVHNEYPVLWAKTGREFWDRARPDGDYVFFMRSGYTGSWRYASVMWTGDSNMNWEKYDGIPSTIPAVNSVGISGFPITSTDIAGYHCLTTKPSDKELFFRWTQLGAMLPVMRTHASSGCAGNWLFDTDRETLLHFKKYAELHIALFPYFYTLAYEASEKGYPVIRHLVIHYPDDKGSQDEQYEFMIGDRILVSPVIENKARERDVYFPPGGWVSFWNGKHYQGPGRTRVSAPLEEIPIFVKNASIVPVFDSQIDTLVKEDRPDLNGWDDANKSIKVLFFGKGEDDYRLWDGTQIHCESQKKNCDINNSPVKRKFSFEFR